jgi:MSHA biogenesis protein MshP
MSRKSAVRGFSLITTVFLITVLAALALFIVTVGIAQRETSTLSVQGARAWAAAMSGIEWGAQQALESGSCAASTPFTLSGGALAGFDVTVDCTATAVTEGAAGYNVFYVAATATSGTPATGDLVSRTVNATFTDAP